MKIVLSILLLFITSMYVLPVKDLFAAKNSVCMADMDEGKEDDCKKEKAKEFFNFTTSFIYITDNYTCTHLHITPVVQTLLHTVETPPPDLA